MNTREIAYRSSHLELKQDDDRYWQWSFDEIGRWDIPAFIDLVLNVTGVDKLPLLVYSQGFTSSLVLLSTRPEYNDKVDILLGYGPVANISHARFPFPTLFGISDELFLLLDPLGDSGYLHVPSAPNEVTKLICGLLRGQPCSLLLAITLLTSAQQLNNTRVPAALAHYPAGTSYQNLRHFVQVYRAKNFVMYDYGFTENKKRYGKARPPAYPVENITVPVALFSSKGDTLADPDDVASLAQRLGSVLLFNNILPQADFRHVDFLFGCRATNFLHQPMIDTLESRAEGGS
ncbi:lipase lipl-1-like isoform X2 [Amblyomma americanum]